MHAFIRNWSINYFIISGIFKFNIINTSIFKIMEIIVITISKTFIYYRIYFSNEWVIEFIFYYNI